jgi:hypothetical protein
VELESYYDGVPGWGAKGYELTPVVKPGGSFVVRCTPARAMKDAQQELSSAEIYDFEYTPREPD